MRRLAAWRDALHRMVVHASMREEEARTEASGKSREYREASREHRVLELLREKRYRRWLEDAELEERKFLDEIHLLRLARSGSGKED
jgi:flagellar biosynthesis chaperone FliJ